MQQLKLATSVTPHDDSKTLGEEVYGRLRSDLIAGRLLPGTKLPFRQLSVRYGVGIAPLREALSRLASERLVHFEGNRGYAVAPVSLADLRDLCSLRVDLSCKALRASVELGDEHWEAEILASLHRLQRSPLPKSLQDDSAFDEWERRHDHFHHSLIASCGSPWLLHFCAVLSDQFQRYRRIIIMRMTESSDLLNSIREQHRTIAEASIARDADLAVRCLQEHFEGSVRFVISRFEDLERESGMQ